MPVVSQGFQRCIRPAAGHDAGREEGLGRQAPWKPLEDLHHLHRLQKENVPDDLLPELFEKLDYAIHRVRLLREAAPFSLLGRAQGEAEKRALERLSQGASKGLVRSKLVWVPLQGGRGREEVDLLPRVGRGHVREVLAMRVEHNHKLAGHKRRQIREVIHRVEPNAESAGLADSSSLHTVTDPRYALEVAFRKTCIVVYKEPRALKGPQPLVSQRAAPVFTGVKADLDAPGICIVRVLQELLEDGGALGVVCENLSYTGGEVHLLTKVLPPVVQIIMGSHHGGTQRLACGPSSFCHRRCAPRRPSAEEAHAIPLRAEFGQDESAKE
mmetsp:Transcript_15965/g.50154  ORF Transcript_15965/g.50154 Transcript_15965/m.50154 type:complete len:327 (+) Transcript_15965:322-1302(+)